MDETRSILYGVADYAQIRRKNAWFVDRTAKIRDLESIAYAVFLRPRRFGKSLFTSILEAYYDVRYADRFDEFFSGTDIGANPTDECGREHDSPHYKRRGRRHDIRVRHGGGAVRRERQSRGADGPERNTEERKPVRRHVERRAREYGFRP